MKRFCNDSSTRLMNESQLKIIMLEVLSSSIDWVPSFPSSQQANWFSAPVEFWLLHLRYERNSSRWRARTTENSHSNSCCSEQSILSFVVFRLHNTSWCFNNNEKVFRLPLDCLSRKCSLRVGIVSVYVHSLHMWIKLPFAIFTIRICRCKRHKRGVFI